MVETTCELWHLRVPAGTILQGNGRHPEPGGPRQVMHAGVQLMLCDKELVGAPLWPAALSGIWPSTASKAKTSQFKMEVEGLKGRAPGILNYSTHFLEVKNNLGGLSLQRTTVDGRNAAS